MKLKNETYFELNNDFYNFTVVQNYILEDERITDNALGLYMRIIKFQNSPNHKIYLKGLITEVNKKAKVTNAMNELIEYGYITREQLRNEKGQMQGYRYTVHMKPCNPCKISVSTESRKTEIGKTEIGKTSPKKENKVINKIDKKENSSYTKPQEEERPSFILSLLPNIRLTKKHKQILNSYDMDKVKAIIEKHGSKIKSFQYIIECYETPIEIGNEVQEEDGCGCFMEVEDEATGEIKKVWVEEELIK